MKTGTKKQRNALREYVRWMANELELRDWTIDIVYDPPPDDQDAIACVLCTYGRKHAQIKICTEWFELDLEKQRSTIAHELIHCHLSSIEWQFNNIGSNLPTPLFDAVWGGIKDQIEFATDAMADAIARHLPVPNYAKVKG